MDKLNASAVYGPEHEGMTTYPTGAHGSAFVIVRRAYTPISGDQTTIDQRLRGERAAGNVWSAPRVFGISCGLCEAGEPSIHNHGN